MQTLLVLAAFIVAVCYLVTRFVWSPFETANKKNKPRDHSDCGKCSFR